MVGFSGSDLAQGQQWWDDFNDNTRNPALWAAPEGDPTTTFIERSGRLEFEGGPSGYSNQRFEVFFNYDEPWRVQCRAMVDPVSFTSLGQVGLIGLQVANDSGFSTGDEFVAFHAASGVLEPGGSAAVGLVTGWADETVEDQSISLRGTATPVGLRIEYHPADRTLHLFSNEDPGLAESSWSESAVFAVDGSTVTGAQTLDWGMGAGDLFVLMFNGSVDLTTLGAGAAWVDDFEVRTLRPLLQPTPRHRIAEAGDEVVLSVTADGPGPLTYEWYAYEGTIPAGTDTTGSTLILPNQTAPGLYQVQVSNDYGTTENEPTAVSLTRDGSHSLSLTVEGSGRLSFRPEGIHWETLSGANPAGIVVDGNFNPLTESPLPATPEERVAYIEQSFFESCVTLNPVTARGTLRILQQPTPDNGHELIVEIDDTGFAGSARYGFQLFGRTLQKAGQDPVVILNPADRCAPTGGKVRFTANVFNSSPITLQWRHDGVAIPGENGTELLIAAAGAGDAGQYDLVYTDPWSNSWATSAAELTLDTGSPQTLTFAPLDPILTTTAPFALAATSDSGLDPEYSSNHHEIALVCGGLLKPVSPGSVSITARQDGNGSFHGATEIVRVLDIYEPIVLVTQPASQTVNVGSDVTFTVAAETLAFGTLSYQWLKDDVEIPGATGATLALTGVTGNNAGNYRVIVSHPAEEVPSATATLTVNRLAQTISFDPLASRLTTDAPFSLTATTTSGLPVSFSSSNPAVASISGMTVTLHGPGTATIIASQAGDSTYLPAVSVQRELEVIAPVTIVSHPVAVSTDALQDVLFEVVASGSAPLSYQWRKNGGPIPGATSPQLSLTAVTTDDQGSYDCVVTNPAGSTPTNAASLTVNRLSQTLSFAALPDRLTTDPAFPLSATASSGLPVTFSSLTPATLAVSGSTATPLAEGAAIVRAQQAGNPIYLPASLDRSFSILAPVVITAQPVTQSADALDTVSFTVAATGTGPLGYQWRKNGSPIPGATSASLTLVEVTTDDSASYDCLVTNAAGSEPSAAATLTVNRLSQTITFAPLSPVYDTDPDLNLTATASSGLPVSYTSGTPSVATVSGSSASPLSPGDTLIIASQDGDSVYAPATPVARTLTVLDSLTFTSQPVSLTRNALEDATFSVSVSGQGPFSYQWRKNGTAIPGATAASLTLVEVTTDDAASYDCLVTNAAGSEPSAAATLTVNRLSQTVTFLTTMPTNLTSGVGWQPVFISAQAYVSPVWFSLSNSTGGIFLQEFEPGSWQIVNNGAIAGEYLVTAHSAGDTIYLPATASQTLVIQEPVVIQSHPGDQTVGVGASASFSVTATGSNLTYQWRKNGAAIPGATSATFTIASASEADAGSYDCVVSNPATSETSTAAVLTVQAVTGPRQILINFGNNNAGAGWNNVSAAALNTGNPIPLTDQSSGASGASLLGFGPLDPSLNAFDPAIGSAQNTGSWNGGAEKNGLPPAAAADYVGFQGPAGDFFVAVTGLQPGRRYRLEVLAATEHIELPAQAHVIVHRWTGPVVTEAPDRDANDTPNLANLGGQGEINTRSQGWQAANWLIWDEVIPGLEQGDLLGLPGTRADVLLLAFSNVGPGGSSGAINAIRLTELDAAPQGGITDWFTANGLTGADAIPEAKPAGDDIPNLLKYAFNMDPNTSYSGDTRHLTAGSGQSGLPSITTSKTPGGQRLRIEFVRRRNDNSLGYQAQFSIDNTIWVPAVAAPTVTVIDADWERVVVEDLLDVWPTRFGRVRVYLAE